VSFDAFDDDSPEGLGNLLRYPGGKSRLRKKLIKHFPEHKTYVEPFAGGASMFFGKPKAEKNVLNDKRCEIVKFYGDVARGGLRGCKYKSSKAAFDRIKAKMDSGKRLTACEFLALNKTSYGGEMDHWTRDDADEGVVNPKARKVFEKLGEYEARLKGVKLHCGDFEKVVKKYDGKDTFFFMDPPYNKAVSVTNLKRFYPAGSVTPARVAQVARKVRGKLMITYGDHPDVRKEFCGRGASGKGDRKLRCYTVGTKYSQKVAGSGGSTKWRDVRELVVTNYPIVKKRRTER